MEILKLKNTISEIKKKELDWLNRRIEMKKESDIEIEIVCHQI